LKTISRRCATPRCRNEARFVDLCVICHNIGAPTAIEHKPRERKCRECGIPLVVKRGRPPVRCDVCRRSAVIRRTASKCLTCGVQIVRGRRGPVAKWCSRECRCANGRYYTKRVCAHPECARKVEKWQRFCSERCAGVNRNCERCGSEFTVIRAGYRKSFCSNRCWAEGRRKELRAKPRTESDLTRSQRHGVEYEPINRFRVYERDKWICGICGDLVDSELDYPDPMAASLDHVVPLSLGGAHLYTNVQCSHWQCNVRKNIGKARKVAATGASQGA
jgi:hypothetical protein